MSCRLSLSLLLLLSLVSHSSMARTVTDMAGRSVEIPEHPQRLFPAITALTPILVALAPDHTVALSFALPEGAQDFLPTGISQLPIIPVLQNPDAEQVLSIQTDLVLSWTGPSSLQNKTLALMERLHKPVVLLDAEHLSQYPATFRRLGDILQRPERGEQLAVGLEQRLSALQQALADIPAQQRPRVYYSETPDGLTSQCADSTRMEVIRLAGGRPALDCRQTDFSLSQSLSLEQVLLINPEVILTRDAKTAEYLRSDPRWQSIQAVRQGRIYSIPALPFNWFDRPPSFMRLLGARWLAGLLHPQRFPEDLRPYTRTFMQEFFQTTPSEAALDRLLLP